MENLKARIAELGEQIKALTEEQLSEGLGPLPEDTLRQQAFVILSRLQSGTEDVVRLDAAIAAVAAERERCATLCEDAKPRGGRMWTDEQAACFDCLTHVAEAIRA